MDQTTGPGTAANDNWRRLEEIFTAAVELSGQTRTDLVIRETADNPALRQQLLDLLQHADGAEERISAAIEAAAQAVPEANWTGRRFGPYRVLREVGRGGMGIVFEAIRDDAEYSKRVALKVAGALRHRDALRERFLQERQILAELEHPRIARFLDGGTEQGLPYFAMEFVEGLPVTQYSRERNLTVAGRVKLFREICEAIEYAHGRLIVHRDLKPGNILVTADGRPKVLDFGIAKLMDSAATGSQTTGIALWTPDYASPEQLRGQTITTRSDVYALGLILYEMLSGKPAQVADTSSPLALDRSVCETDARPPSEVAEEPTASLLKGDLDCMIAKAIEKEPERRYASVSALSDDLRRYLAGEPVSAQPATRGYRLSKYVKRNRIAIAAGLAIGLSVAGGTVMSLVQARRAERRFQQVRQLANTFLFDFHDRIQNLQGATEARQYVLSTAMQYLDSLARESGGDARLQLELATAYARLGSVQGQLGVASLGQWKEALVSYGKAVQLAQQPLDVNPGDAAALRLLARSLGERAEIEGNVARDQTSSAASLQQAVQYSQRLLNRQTKVEPGDEQHHLVLLRRQADRMVGSDPKAAVAIYREALARGEALLRAGGGIDDRRQLATTCARIHRALHSLGDPRGGLAMLEKGLALLEPLLDQNGRNPALRPVLSALLIQMGGVLGDPQSFHLNEPAKALAALERARKMEADAAAADPKNVHARENLALALQRMACVRLRVDPRAAITTAREAVALSRQLHDMDPGNLRHAQIHGSARTSLAWAYLAAGEAANAVAQYTQEPVPAKEALARYGNDLASFEVALHAHWVLGMAHTGTRQWEQANRHLGEAWQMADALVKRLPEDLYFLRDFADVEEAEGDLAAARGDRGGAVGHWRTAVRIWERWSRLAAAPSVFPDLPKARLRKKLGN
ncbi:MAG: serine/threonine protein kinase [Bryobacterales bacterium]|nr:serine/threonine protein kinase [Bryobacterales bacterium]